MPDAISGGSTPAVWSASTVGGGMGTARSAPVRGRRQPAQWRKGTPPLCPRDTAVRAVDAGGVRPGSPGAAGREGQPGEAPGSRVQAAWKQQGDREDTARKQRGSREQSASRPRGRREARRREPRGNHRRNCGGPAARLPRRCTRGSGAARTVCGMRTALLTVVVGVPSAAPTVPAPRLADLPGMLGTRQRAAPLGGTLPFGPLPSGGFRVRATLPAQQGAAA